MSWRAGVAGVFLTGTLLGAGVGGCWGDEEPPAAVVVGEFPADMIGRSWQVAFATQAEQDRIVGQSRGWVDLVMERNLKSAVQSFGPSGGPALARAHVEASILYRQAALLAANSFVQTYATAPAPTDPVGVAHLLAVSYVVRGELDDAKKWLPTASAEPAVVAWAKPWSAGAWPPDLSQLPLSLPAPTAGEWPEVESLPHYVLPEKGVATTIEMADPGALLALAMWHEQAARAVAPTAGPEIDTVLARYALPVERFEGRTSLSEAFLFGSDFLVPEDASFVADLMRDGPGAVDAHSGSSLLANIAAQARVDGKLDPEKAMDLASGLQKKLIEVSLTAANGQENPGHKTFASIGEVGTLRVLALVADKEGNREASGVLRIRAMEKSDGATGCANGLLSLAAWDAQNRYPQRGLELLNQLIRRYPSLDVARYALDVLAVRVSREGTNLPPGM